MDIYQLEVFLSVYRQKSFTVASKELNLTQPSVSMHIKKLEQELGVVLFEKVGRMIVPTKQATLLYNRAEEILQRIRDIKSDLSSSEREIRGIISIGATDIPGSYVLPPLSAEFSKVYPEVFFEIIIEETRKISDMVLDGSLFLGVVDELTQRSTIECLHQFKDELVLVCAPGFIGKKVITPVSLFRIPLLMREEGSESRQSMQKQHLLHKISIKALNVKAILGSSYSLHQAVKAGLGAAILSRFVVRDDLQSGALEEIRVRGVNMKRTFYVITRKKRAMPAHYQAFVGFLREKLLPS